MKNLCGKTRDVTRPYEVWTGQVSIEGEVLNMVWKVLKKYQAPEAEARNPFARWFCAVQSEATFGSEEMGDVYISDIKRFGTLVSKEAL